MTADDLALLADELAPIVKAYVDQSFAALQTRNKELELRLLELETQPRPQPERGERGEMGAKGDSGVSITNTLINADGRLIVQLSDGRVQDAGPIPAGQVGPPGAPGEKGEPGLSIKGDIGPAGRDADPIDVGAIVERITAMLPTPLPGKDGAPGEKGERGEIGPPGQDAPPVDVEAVVARVALLVPAGKDGAVGPQGDKGDRGERGEIGMQGKDGTGVMDAMQDRQGHLILTLSDGRTKDVGPVLGADGAPGRNGLDGKDGRDGVDGKDGAVGLNGKDGRDGLNGKDVDMGEVKALITSELNTWPRPKDGVDGRSVTTDEVKALVINELNTWPRPKDGADGRDGTLEGLTFSFDGKRTVTACYKDGTPIEGGTWTFPVTIYQGVYQHGKAYQQGDSITHDGHTWIATTDTTEMPGEGSKAWQLSVRRGKQGKEGKPGKDFTPRTTNTPPLYG